MKWCSVRVEDDFFLQGFKMYLACVKGDRLPSLICVPCCFIVVAVIQSQVKLAFVSSFRSIPVTPLPTSVQHEAVRTDGRAGRAGTQRNCHSNSWAGHTSSGWRLVSFCRLSKGCRAWPLQRQHGDTSSQPGESRVRPLGRQASPIISISVLVAGIHFSTITSGRPRTDSLPPSGR